MEIVNRQASFNYFVEETYEAGIVLTGTEIKSIRNGKVNIKDTYTLKSHLFEEDGKWVFNDLAQSSLIWTVINGQKYEIILDSLSVDETDNNGIYEATIKFHFSEPTTLL